MHPKHYITTPNRHSVSRSNIISLLLVTVLASVDLLQKQWALAHLNQGQTLPFIPKLLQWRLTYNTGGPWSVFADSPAIVLGVGLCTILLLVYFWWHEQKYRPGIYWHYVLITAGAIGNLWNRVSLGAVIDSIELIPIHYPVFNIADVLICGGIILWLVTRLVNKPTINSVSTQGSL